MSSDSVREKRDMCLVRSVGDIIHSFEVASSELENEGKNLQKNLNEYAVMMCV